MNFLKNLFFTVGRFFRTSQAASQTTTALEHVGKALPYVVAAAELITRLSKSTKDDGIWTAMKLRYPEVFDGTPKTGEALKRAALQIAARELQLAFPSLSTSVAIAAAQLAYIDHQAASESPAR